MHYATYLDEFGHIGPYISKDDPRYNDSPTFGLAGITLPVEEVREFAIWFYQLKCQLLAWELKLMILLDEQQAGDQWRMNNVEACTLAMFEDKEQRCRTIIEPPIQAESHLFQTLQCADWICGLVGRLTTFAVAADAYPDWEVFNKYFQERIRKVSLPGSGLEKQLSASVPAAPDALLSDSPAKPL